MNWINLSTQLPPIGKIVFVLAQDTYKLICQLSIDGNFHEWPLGNIDIRDKWDSGEIKWLNETDMPKLGSKGTVDIVYNFNQPPKPVDCELLAIYKDGRIVVQCYDIHGEKWESETFSRLEFFKPKAESKIKEVCPKCDWPIVEEDDNGILVCYWCGKIEEANDCLPVDSTTTVSVGKKLKETDDE